MQGHSTIAPHQNEIVHDTDDDIYRRTQSQIYRLQETLLNSSKAAKEFFLPVVQGSDAGAKDVISQHSPPPAATTTSANVITNLGPNIFSSSTRELPIVDSTPILRYTKSKCKELPRLIGEITYHPTKTGTFKSYNKPETYNQALETPSSQTETLSYLSNFKAYDIPDPLLPNFTRDKINKLIKIKIPYCYIRDLRNSTLQRATHAQLWGTDIYTDDSDPLLALQHVGFFDTDAYDLKKLTPANLSNFNDVVGMKYATEIGNDVKGFDLEVTVLLLDTLEGYVGCDRFGVCSRDWCDGVAPRDGVAPHDGLSFGIYQIEVKPVVSIV